MTIIGIHTPETEEERSLESVQAKVKESGFTLPVLADNDRPNWTAWGNGIWPSVYLIDKRGSLRYWWYGELNWQGAEGERTMRQLIAELLAEEIEP